MTMELVPKRSETATRPAMNAQLLAKLMIGLVLAVMVVATVGPIIWMAIGGFKSGAEFYGNIWGIPSEFTFDNFVYAWTDGNMGQKFVNSLIVTAGTLALVLPITTSAGYALAHIGFRGRQIAFAFIVLGIMVPFGVIAVPVFTVIIDLGLVNTHLGLVLVYTANAIPLGVFLMYSFFRSIPTELADAALLDGCTPFGAFVRVVLPLARAGIATQVILTGTQVWNEYFMASLIIRSEPMETIPMGLVFFTSRYGTDYPQLFAALTIASLPLVLLYLSAQRQFISGMAAGAVKG
jgi:raffinose/stachyose/melibiose transport system permease protein